MELIFGPGKLDDIDELEQLYNDLNDYLAAGVNYSGWKKGVYPVRQTAIEGINEGTLYVARSDGKIVGSVILNHLPEPAYHNVNWEIEADYSDVIVIRTFVVHPEYLKCGIGKATLAFAVEHSIKAKARSLRLDVYEGNIPAIRLYEKCGFKYIDTVDLGLGEHGLHWFKLYEKLL
jgi:GNAT superfamily N-acetyltransferase